MVNLLSVEAPDVRDNATIDERYIVIYIHDDDYCDECCEECGYDVDDCQCCSDCEQFPCDCCSRGCGQRNRYCECCETCLMYPCTCPAPQEDEET